MEKNKESLKRNIKFLFGIAVLDLVGDILKFDSSKILGLIISIVCFVTAALAYYSLNKEDSNGKLFATIVGVVETLLGTLYLVSLIINYNTITLNYKYILFIIPIAEILIGLIVLYQSLKLEKE